MKIIVTVGENVYFFDSETLQYFYLVSVFGPSPSRP